MQSSADDFLGLWRGRGCRPFGADAILNVPVTCLSNLGGRGSVPAPHAVVEVPIERVVFALAPVQVWMCVGMEIAKAKSAEDRVTTLACEGPAPAAGTSQVHHIITAGTLVAQERTQGLVQRPAVVDNVCSIKHTHTATFEGERNAAGYIAVNQLEGVLRTRLLRLVSDRPAARNGQKGSLSFWTKCKVSLIVLSNDPSGERHGSKDDAVVAAGPDVPPRAFRFNEEAAPAAMSELKCIIIGIRWLNIEGNSSHERPFLGLLEQLKIRRQREQAKFSNQTTGHCQSFNVYNRVSSANNVCVSSPPVVAIDKQC